MSTDNTVDQTPSYPTHSPNGRRLEYHPTTAAPSPAKVAEAINHMGQVLWEYYGPDQSFVIFAEGQCRKSGRGRTRVEYAKFRQARILFCLHNYIICI